MAIAITLQEFLNEAGVGYDLLHHPYTNTSEKTARAAHIRAEQLAKPVVLEDERGYLLAVVPATRRVALEKLERILDRRLMLAKEQESTFLFDDCERGAIPAVGQAYGVRVIWDDSLLECNDVYFEAGDHTDLVHMTGHDFQRLMSGTDHGAISQPA